MATKITVTMTVQADLEQALIERIEKGAVGGAVSPLVCYLSLTNPALTRLASPTVVKVARV